MDYARFGRQIALPEIGVEGQARLAESALVAPHTVSPMASQLWTAAGGASSPRPPPPSLGGGGGGVEASPRALGEAAWWCVESARRALGQSARELPAELLERLGV